MALVYLLIFLGGLFIVWYLGRREHYDEEKLIDLVLVSTGGALILSRVAFFLTVAGREVFEAIVSDSNIWVLVLRLFDLSNGAVLWVAVVGFFVIMTALLFIWKWPFWPVGGITIIGIGVVIALFSLVVAISNWITDAIYWLIGSTLITGVFSYLYFWGGDKKISAFIADFKRGYSENSKKLREKRLSKNKKEKDEVVDDKASSIESKVKDLKSSGDEKNT